MNNIVQIVLGIITSIGGIGAIFTAVIKFSSNFIAERLEEKYSLKLNKELEAYKSSLENKNYISKTKFDAEFEIYKNLSKSFFEMVKNISIMIPPGFTTIPADEEAKKEYDNKNYDAACKSCELAQDTLNSSAPFISEDIFNKYSEIIHLCIMQLRAFERRWNISYMKSQKDKEKFTNEEYSRTSEINEKFKELNNDIRDYLNKLEVID